MNIGFKKASPDGIGNPLSLEEEQGKVSLVFSQGFLRKFAHG